MNHHGQADIEELRAIERELRLQNAQLQVAAREAEAHLQEYQELFELAPDGYLATDPDGIVQKANRAAGELLQRPHEALIGSSLIDVVAPDDQPTFRAQLERFQEGHRDRVYDWKVRLQSSGDGLRYVTVTVAALRDARGQLLNLRWLWHDITERQQLQSALFERENALRRREEYFRSLIENTSDIITIVNADGTIRYESPAIERVLGYKPEELIGRNVRDFVHPDDAALVAGAVAEAFHHPGVAQSIEIRLRHRDGSWRIIEAIGKRPTAPPGIAGVVVNSRDITERKRGEEEAARHQAELSYLLRLSTMGEMASGIAHELNQPLAAIANYAKGCARRITTGMGDPAHIVPALEEIAVQAMRAGEIIRRLRNFVRKSELRPESVDVNELVREVARFIEAEAREQAVRVQLELAPQLPEVCVDAIQMEQVVLNLVRNGLEAVSGVEGDKRALLLRTSRGDDAVEIAFTDTGVGLSPEIAEKMFDPFFSTKAGGLGMGLSISRSIVEAHGGRLWATPNPPGGTTFRLTLPLHRSNGNPTSGSR